MNRIDNYIIGRILITKYNRSNIKNILYIKRQVCNINSDSIH